MIKNNNASHVSSRKTMNEQTDITAAHMPMSRPDLVMAQHPHQGGHNVAWTLLDDGRIISYQGGFCFSGDGGLTWTPPCPPRDGHGNTFHPGAPSLVKLADYSIGMTYTCLPPGAADVEKKQAAFRRSDDGGKTWSDPIEIGPGLPLGALQDVLLRTSTGRIIWPAYLAIGKGNFHREDAPFLGGYVKGHFVSTDAHFFDPHFFALIVFFSDDEGRTWQRNSDGELFIILPQTNAVEMACEPSVAEISPGNLLMLMRTRLGRHFQAWSHDNGETWTRPQPTQLAGTQVPCQVRALPGSGHLLCVFNQHSELEIRRGFVRQRLSTAISRNAGGVWEFFQNVASILPESHVEPGPIRFISPAQGYSMGEWPAPENDAANCLPLPENYGRFAYPSVLALKDRVLISHTHGSWRKDLAIATDEEKAFNAVIKVLPLNWFYGGATPARESPVISKLTKLAPQP